MAAISARSWGCGGCGGCCGFGVLVGFAAMSMAFANNLILFSSPCGRGEKQKVDITGVMGIVAEEDVFGPCFF
eukprot:356725-Ditylum_brightwellii.AAC.1